MWWHPGLQGNKCPGNALVSESHQHPLLPFAKQACEAAARSTPCGWRAKWGSSKWVCAARLCLNQGKCPFTPQRALSPDSVTTPPATIPFCTRVTSGEPTSHPFNQVENGSGELGHAVLMLGQIRSIHSSVLFTEDYLRGWERTSSFSSRAEVNLD